MFFSTIACPTSLLMLLHDAGCRSECRTSTTQALGLSAQGDLSHREIRLSFHSEIRLNKGSGRCCRQAGVTCAALSGKNPANPAPAPETLLWLVHTTPAPAPAAHPRRRGSACRRTRWRRCHRRSREAGADTAHRFGPCWGRFPCRGSPPPSSLLRCCPHPPDQPTRKRRWRGRPAAAAKRSSGASARMLQERAWRQRRPPPPRTRVGFLRRRHSRLCLRALYPPLLASRDPASVSQCQHSAGRGGASTNDETGLCLYAECLYLPLADPRITLLGTVLLPNA